MARDGNLGPLFQKKIERAHFQSVETFSTGRGVPDLNYCIDGTEGWIELKDVKRGWKPIFQAEQIGWMERRVRNGGKVFVAVRVRIDRDALYIFPGGKSRILRDGGIRATSPNLVSYGGPAYWDWEAVRKLLVS